MTGKPADWKGSDGRARTEVVTFLKQHGGEVADEAGYATVEMQQHLGRSRSLSNLLRTMEHDGMIAREVRGRRTYRIALVDDWGLGANDGVGTVTPIRPSLDGAQPAIDGSVDFDLLAESLLAIVLRKIAEPAPKPDKGITDRLRRAEATSTKLEEQLTILSGERDQLRARVADLEGQVERYEHNMGVLRAELDKPARRRGGGTPLAERLSADERSMLDELMRSLPETPQSRPRRTRS